MIAARCLLLLLIKTTYKSKAGRVKTIIVLGSGGCLCRTILDSDARIPPLYTVTAPTRGQTNRDDLIKTDATACADHTGAWNRQQATVLFMRPADTAVGANQACENCLPAGGHTAEMLMLVSGLDKHYYSPRVYVVAETDKMSAKRALTREQEWSTQQVGSRLRCRLLHDHIQDTPCLEGLTLQLTVLATVLAPGGCHTHVWASLVSVLMSPFCTCAGRPQQQQAARATAPAETTSGCSSSFSVC